MPNPPKPAASPNPNAPVVLIVEDDPDIRAMLVKALAPKYAVYQAADGLEAEVNAALQKVEQLAERTFGDATNPLLVSVRSGAPASMPGMMDTILNLGLNDQTVDALAKQSGNARFAVRFEELSVTAGKGVGARR